MNTKKMKKLPIPDELNSTPINYGNKEQRINFHNTDIEYSIPKIENGYYSIFDRTPESKKILMLIQMPIFYFMI